MNQGQQIEVLGRGLGAGKRQVWASCGESIVLTSIPTPQSPHQKSSDFPLVRRSGASGRTLRVEEWPHHRYSKPWFGARREVRRAARSTNRSPEGKRSRRSLRDVRARRQSARCKATQGRPRGCKARPRSLRQMRSIGEDLRAQATKRSGTSREPKRTTQSEKRLGGNVPVWRAPQTDFALPTSLCGSSGFPERQTREAVPYWARYAIQISDQT